MAAVSGTIFPMPKTDKLKLKLAKARQAAYAALQAGNYRDAAKACEKADKLQKQFWKAEEKSRKK